MTQEVATTTAAGRMNADVSRAAVSPRLDEATCGVPYESRPCAKRGAVGYLPLFFDDVDLSYREAFVGAHVDVVRCQHLDSALGWLLAGGFAEHAGPAAPIVIDGNKSSALYRALTGAAANTPITVNDHDELVRLIIEALRTRQVEWTGEVSRKFDLACRPFCGEAPARQADSLDVHDRLDCAAGTSGEERFACVRHAERLLTAYGPSSCARYFLQVRDCSVTRAAHEHAMRSAVHALERLPRLLDPFAIERYRAVEHAPMTHQIQEGCGVSYDHATRLLLLTSQYQRFVDEGSARTPSAYADDDHMTRESAGRDVPSRRFMSTGHADWTIKPYSAFCGALKVNQLTGPGCERELACPEPDLDLGTRATLGSTGGQILAGDYRAELWATLLSTMLAEARTAPHQTLGPSHPTALCISRVPRGPSAHLLGTVSSHRRRPRSDPPIRIALSTKRVGSINAEWREPCAKFRGLLTRRSQRTVLRGPVIDGAFRCHGTHGRVAMIVARVMGARRVPRETRAGPARRSRSTEDSDGDDRHPPQDEVDRA